jgi:hypothetical protein
VTIHLKVSYFSGIQSELIVDGQDALDGRYGIPRRARLDAPGTIHHIIARGIAGTKIVRTRKDREDFLRRIAERCEAGALAVYAWALMDTHFHVLLRTGSESTTQALPCNEETSPSRLPLRHSLSTPILPSTGALSLVRLAQ